MKISVPGFPVRYVDEEPPQDAYVPPAQEVERFPTAEEAMSLALQRARAWAAVQNAASGAVTVADGVALGGTQVLDYTRDVPSEASPLIDNAKAVIDPGVNPSAALEHGAGVVPTGTSEPPVENGTDVEVPTDVTSDPLTQ